MESIIAKDEFSLPIFRAARSVKLYKVLVAYLRFDDAETRELRKTNNTGAAISEI